MNKKVIMIIVAIAIILALGFVGITYKNNSSNDKLDNNNSSNITKDEENIHKELNKTLMFLQSIKGLKANNVEIVDNPVGFKGELIAPKETILSGVDYFLQNTDNGKMKDISINMDDDYVGIKVNYDVTNNITTPIEVKVVPTLNNNKDLLLEIREVKFLDLKVYKWVVNLVLDKFVKDWFPKDQNLIIEFNEGNVILSKENFKGIILNKLTLDAKALKIDAVIDLETLIPNNNKK